MGFLDAALALPTGIFSLLLVVALIYWAFVILGAFDIDVLDASEGGDPDAGEGVLAGLLAALGLKAVPVTVVLTLVVLFGWLASFFGMRALADFGVVGVLVSAGVGVAAVLLALPFTSLAVRPLRPLFKTTHARSRAELVGGTCTIATQSVSDRFGQANAQLGGDHLLIQVRCTPGNPLRKGDEALIVDFDRGREAYLVEPLKAR